jgi:exopolysaccharide biosynthesis polyprenyl glycosylphosphotransferase
MLKQHAKAVERLVLSVDLALVACSVPLALTLVTSENVIPNVERFVPFVLVAAFVWFVLLRHAGFYRSLRTRQYGVILLKVAQTALLAGILNAALLFLMAPSFSRRVYVTHVVLAAVLILCWRVGICLLQRTVRRRGYNFRRLLIVGTQGEALRFIKHIEEHEEWGFKIIGCVQGANGPEKKTCLGHSVLGRIESTVDICKQQAVDEVIVAMPKQYMDRLEQILPRLECMGITVRLALDFYKPRQSRVLVGYLGDDDPLPVITYYRMTLDPMQLFLKRVMDIVGGLLGLGILGLLFPLIALAIKLDSPGPVLFRQRRVGQNGRIFTCYKFRSMSVDAEARKVALIARNEMHGAMFKMENDPRITRIGRFLRKASLDELPQFWNVLNGDMSLVGTRPPTPEEVEQYEEWQRARICIKPGLTGVWQTSGRNKITDFDRICQLDVYYIDNWSVWLDLKLLMKTIGVVVAGIGAR